MVHFSLTLFSPLALVALVSAAAVPAAVQRGVDAAPTNGIHRPWASALASTAWAVPTSTALAASTKTLGLARIAAAPQATSPSSFISVPAGMGTIILTSNDASYGYKQVRADLKKIMAWAYDTGNLTPAQFDETAAAIMSAAARYYPEIGTKAMCRIIMADIRAESDFQTKSYDAGRMDSGPSIGLLQVSPGGGSQEMPLWQQHARVSANTYSWNLGAKPNRGILIDWKTGKQMVLGSLKFADLYRPWVNIHMAMWVQSNSARTSSQDPYEWQEISKQTLAGASAATLNRLLTGTKLPRSVKTGLGSWVAGTATNGYGSYMQDGDDISPPYFQAILAGVSVLYGETKTAAWLDRLVLNAGLIDYR